MDDTAKLERELKDLNRLIKEQVGLTKEQIRLTKDQARLSKERTKAITDQTKMQKFMLIQNIEYHNDIKYIKTYLRILVDKYQEEAGIDKIEIDGDGAIKKIKAKEDNE